MAALGETVVNRTRLLDVKFLTNKYDLLKDEELILEVDAKPEKQTSAANKRASTRDIMKLAAKEKQAKKPRST